MKVFYGDGLLQQGMNVVEPVKVLSFPEDLRPNAMRQLVYTILINEEGAGYTAQQLGSIYNVVSSIDIRPYIVPVCNKDANSIFLLCTELYNLLTICGISIDINYLYNSLMQ